MFFFLLSVCAFRGFLTDVASQQGGAMSRAERGEVPLSEVGGKASRAMPRGNTAHIILFYLTCR